MYKKTTIFDRGYASRENSGLRKKAHSVHGYFAAQNQFFYTNPNKNKKTRVNPAIKKKETHNN
jgi:hypothetical protein